MPPQGLLQVMPLQFSPNEQAGEPRQQSPPLAPQLALSVTIGLAEDLQLVMTCMPLVCRADSMQLSASTSKVTRCSGWSGALLPMAWTWATLTMLPRGPADQY